MREAGAKKGKRGVTVDHHEASVTANIAERFVVGPRDDVTAVTAHQAELGTRDWWQRVFVSVSMTGARRRINGIRTVEMASGGSRGGGGEGWERWWIHQELRDLTVDSLTIYQLKPMKLMVE